MQGCLAPSEIHGVSDQESAVFGALAENIIYADFYSKHPPFDIYPFPIFIDNYNPGPYLLFLARHNPHFNKRKQIEFYTRLAETKLGVKIPDILIHTFTRKEFYEIKPDSASGIEKGVRKVGILSATYKAYALPYSPGCNYSPNNIVVASVPGQLKVTLKVWMKGPGLIAYKLCLDSSQLLDLVTLSALLRYVVKKANEQKNFPTFRPVDLRTAFVREGELASLAKILGLSMTMAVAGAVSWKYFWRAVAIRFAAQGAKSAFFAAADGPLPIGDLIAAGLSISIIIDIIRLNDTLWLEAAQLELEDA